MMKTNTKIGYKQMGHPHYTFHSQRRSLLKSNFFFCISFQMDGFCMQFTSQLLNSLQWYEKGIRNMQFSVKDESTLSVLVVICCYMSFKWSWEKLWAEEKRSFSLPVDLLENKTQCPPTPGFHEQQSNEIVFPSKQKGR